MTIPLNTIRALERLLSTGEVLISDINPLKTGETLGLWTTSADGSRAVATSETVRLLQALPSLSEAVAAVISCEPEIRLAWGKIIAARLKELGQRRDTQGLCEAIDTLGQAAGAINKILPDATLTPTSYTELERVILNAPAEQAIATPKLLRVLKATAHLIEGKQGISPASLYPSYWIEKSRDLLLVTTGSWNSTNKSWRGLNISTAWVCATVTSNRKTSWCRAIA